MSRRYCVVIPAFNSAHTLGELVRAIHAKQLDIIVVNDGSSDQTAQTASRAGAVVISHLRNMGKGAALRAGFRHALRLGYDGVITIDSDGQHDPKDIGALIQTAEQRQARIVIGNRMADGRMMPPLRRWTNRLMSRLISRLMAQEVPDSQCGFRFIRSDALAALPMASNHFDLETELLLAAARRHWTVVSVPIATIYDNHRSHIHPLQDGLRFVRVIIRYLVCP